MIDARTDARARAHARALREVPVVGADVVDYRRWRRGLRGLLKLPDVVDVENGSMHARVRELLKEIEGRK